MAEQGFVPQRSSMGRRSPSSPTRPARYRTEMSKCEAANCRNQQAVRPVFDQRRGQTSYHPSSPIQDLQASRWCFKHTCSYFFRNGGTCQNKKSPHDSVCMAHTKCPIRDCSNGKLQVIEGDAEDPQSHYNRFEYCALHKCDVPICPEVVAPADNNKPGFLPYCKRHRCAYVNCDQERGERVNFCPKHKCKIQECRMVADDGFQLCVRHVACESPGCKASRAEDRTKKGEYYKFCSTHIKCEASGCEILRILGSKFCGKHACYERGCGQPKDISLHYCDMHRCPADDCDAPRGWADIQVRAQYCTMHTCRDSDCEEFVETGSLYCAEHQCSKPYCLSEATFEGLCGSHLKLKSDTDAKAAAKIKNNELTKQLRETEKLLIQMQVRQADSANFMPRQRHAEYSPNYYGQANAGYAGAGAGLGGHAGSFGGAPPGPAGPGFAGDGMTPGARPAGHAPRGPPTRINTNVHGHNHEDEDDLEDEAELRMPPPMSAGPLAGPPPEGVPLSKRPMSMAAPMRGPSFSGGPPGGVMKGGA